MRDMCGIDGIYPTYFMVRIIPKKATKNSVKADMTAQAV